MPSVHLIGRMAWLVNGQNKEACFNCYLKVEKSVPTVPTVVDSEPCFGPEPNSRET